MKRKFSPHYIKLIHHDSSIVENHTDHYKTSMLILNLTKYYTGMRLGFDKNFGKFYAAIDSNPIQQRRF